MSQTNSEQIFFQMRDNERRQAQFKAFRPGFVAVIEKVLDEYGLAERLRVAQREGRKLRLLQISCGEGLYLHELAAQLESRSLLDSAQLTGLDSDAGTIAVAYEYSRLSRPPRPYLNFLVHDEKKPLESSLGLRLDGPPKFDFIFTMRILEHLAQFQEYVENFYNALQPEGIFYSRDVVFKEGPDGWYQPYPSMEKLTRTIFALRLKQVNGIEVSQALPGLLTRLGATHVQSWPVKVTTDTSTEEGRNFMRQSLIGLYNARPVLLNLKLFTAQEFDEAIKKLYEEANREAVSFSTYMETLAQRPTKGA